MCQQWVKFCPQIFRGLEHLFCGGREGLWGKEGRRRRRGRERRAAEGRGHAHRRKGFASFSSVSWTFQLEKHPENMLNGKQWRCWLNFVVLKNPKAASIMTFCSREISCVLNLKWSFCNISIDHFRISSLSNVFFAPDRQGKAVISP